MRIGVYLIPKNKKWDKLKKKISSSYIKDKSKIYPIHISIVWSLPIKNKNYIKEIKQIPEFNKVYTLKIKRPFSKLKYKAIVIHFYNNYNLKRLIRKANKIATKYYSKNRIFKDPIHMTLAYGKVEKKVFNNLRKLKIKDKEIVFIPRILIF